MKAVWDDAQESIVTVRMESVTIDAPALTLTDVVDNVLMVGSNSVI